MRANGFTLVELLAAMVAGSMLLLTLGWTVSSLARQMPAAPEESRIQRLGKIAPLLSGWIEQAQPPVGGDITFIGEKRQLSLLVPPPQSRAGAGPLRLTLRVHPGAEGQSLVAELDPIDASEKLPMRENSLVSGYRDIFFEYQMAEEGTLPKLITVNFVERGNKVMSVSASPKINGDGSCRFDPVSLTCR